MIAIAEYKESESELAARKFPAVELAGVGKQFGAKVVLDQINLENSAGRTPRHRGPQRLWQIDLTPFTGRS
jgi:hypothetical protein